MIQAHKDMEAVNKGIPGMEQVLTETVTPESMAKIYKAEVLKQME